MKESILLTFLKLFLDKYFLTTVFAIPLTSLVRFFTPENNRIIQKLGNSTYCLCVFCVCFLAIRFLVCCKQTVRKQRRERRKIREFSYEMDEAIMTFFDKCAPEKRELAYDLIAMLEPEVEARGMNMNTLLTKFALKAFLCGVDIEKLDINAPIPRRLAALCLWLAAQVLNESGCDTSAKSAGGYVTDISKCSKAEKKAIAYLYEQGIVKGYQIAGQQFFPDAGLKTGTGTEWLSGAKRCWK